MRALLSVPWLLTMLLLHFTKLISNDGDYKNWHTRSFSKVFKNQFKISIAWIESNRIESIEWQVVLAKYRFIKIKSLSAETLSVFLNWMHFQCQLQSRELMLSNPNIRLNAMKCFYAFACVIPFGVIFIDAIKRINFHTMKLIENSILRQ